MSLWLERTLTGYFQLFGLACGWSGSRLGRLLGSSFLVIILIELATEIGWYFQGTLPFEHLSKYFWKTIQGVNVTYKVVHTWIVLTALFQCQRLRRLQEQLPLVRATTFMYRHLILELWLVLCNLGLLYMENWDKESMRYAFSLQAIRARYLEMMLLVDRLDGQLEQLHRRVVDGSTEYKTLRSEYAHLAKLSRSLSHLFGLSLLLLNILCLGDWIIVCNVYFMVQYLKAMPASWFTLAQTMYVVMPTLVKIWTMCAACHRCVAK
ncbi:hypothetical protein KR084_004162, partial [Drosophila pseudotakahashii]